MNTWLGVLVGTKPELWPIFIENETFLFFSSLITWLYFESHPIKTLIYNYQSRQNETKQGNFCQTNEFFTLFPISYLFKYFKFGLIILYDPFISICSNGVFHSKTFALRSDVSLGDFAFHKFECQVI